MSSSRPFARPVTRRTFLTTVGAAVTALGAAGVAGSLSGCSSSSGGGGNDTVSTKNVSDKTDVIGDDPTGTKTSSTFLDSAKAAVVTGPNADSATRARACNLAASAGVPVFLIDATNEDDSRKDIESELDRLGVDDIVTLKGDSLGSLSSSAKTRETTPDSWPDGLDKGQYSFRDLVVIPDAPIEGDGSGTAPAAAASAAASTSSTTSSSKPSSSAQKSTSSSAPSTPNLPTTSDGAPYTPRPVLTAPWNPDSKADKEPGSDGHVFVAPDTSPASFTNASGAGRNVVRLPAADPRATHESIEIVKKDDHVIALGELFGDKDTLSRRIDKAKSIDKEQPGGGGLVTPGRHIVALYGSTDGPDLGCLGEQGKDASVARAKKMAKSYEAFTDQPVIPAFEIIVTVASSEPEKDNSYSRFIDSDTVEPWIDAINKAGGYAVIDLQPGRMTLLEQAKKYEKLLKKPYVGLALDPEWRLYGNELPMEQIGHVDAQEINDVVKWLDKLTEDNKLPQKPLVVHQFKVHMIRNRDKMIPGTDNIAMVIHIDGHGSQSIKLDTWHVIQQDLNPKISLGWKNFYDEDKPMLDPKDTMAIKPRPDFISYQ